MVQRLATIPTLDAVTTLATQLITTATIILAIGPEHTIILLPLTDIDVMIIMGKQATEK